MISRQIDKQNRKDKGDETACTTFCLVLDGFS